MKKVLITGITGQDGSYLAELLLSKGYQVYGFLRSKESKNFWRISHIADKSSLIEGDIRDQEAVNQAVFKSNPDEIYHLAADSFVPNSWENPIRTTEINALGTLKVLEAVRKLAPKARVLHASSTETFGAASNLQHGHPNTFEPKSPYAISKLCAHWMAINYRESYNMFVCCALSCNHESPRRGVEFVTRKISNAVARIKLGLSNELNLGNIEARRDWGFAGDYVEAMWLMLQQENPSDYVISTGELHSVKDFVEQAFLHVGIENWQGYVAYDTQFLRPSELKTLEGTNRGPLESLGWKPTVRFTELVKMMVDADLERLQNSNNKLSRSDNL